MKIGIIGSPQRCTAWEQHMRGIQGIKEVILARELTELNGLDAVVVVPEENHTGYDRIIHAIRQNLHVFVVAPLPREKSSAERIYHLAEEANVVLQFSHWPSISPASQWMIKQVPSPNFIQVNRELLNSRFRELDTTFEDLWVDELAFCLKWVNSNVKSVDAKLATLETGNNADHPENEQNVAIHIHLRFDNGATAGLYVSRTARDNRFKRVGSDKYHVVESDVLENAVRLGRLNNQGHLFFERNTFDPSQAAELSIHHFVKAIRLKQPSLFNSYDVFQTARTREIIKKRLRRFS